ncbi:acyltransferase family protein [Galactobacter caseinivorans]|uniref:Acyltransferase n=1 Tax=Galactobacter caseinivorans TaxID=2676123 RepID=A0A496PLY3_9MICC|nr:acyltransferase family protein [Galactobacter caseinivorans]RKW71513.1 acyltransferase [Galactobacter caseinivorans]
MPHNITPAPQRQGTSVSATGATAAAAQAPQRSGSFRRDLAGLRGVAVLLVAVYHIWIGRVSGGVDVFLLMSAFFLTGGWARSVDQGAPRTVAGSWLRRLQGLLPAAVLTLVVTVCVTLLLQPATRWAEFMTQAWASLGYTQNQHLAAASVDYYNADHSSASPLQHFWSLSVQGQVFVLWPLLLAGGALLARGLSALAARRGRGPIGFRAVMIVVFLLVGGASLAYSVQFTQSHQAQAYFSTQARLWEFALGSLLALSVDRIPALPRLLSRALGWLGMAALLSCGVLLNVEGQFPGYAALWPTLAAAAIIVAGTGERPLTRADVGWWLSRRPATWLGSISYPLYLWHWPVLVLSLYLLGQERPTFWQGALMLLGAMLLAWLTHRYVEAPATRWAAARRRSVTTARASRSADAHEPKESKEPRQHRVPRLPRLPRLLRLPRQTAALAGALPRVVGRYSGAFQRNARSAAVVLISLAAVLPLAVWQSALTSQERAAAVQPERDNPGAASLESDFVDESDPSSIALPLASQVKNDWATPGEACTGDWVPDNPANEFCLQGGNPEAKKTVVMVGDSHAQQWSPALDAAANHSDLRWVMVYRPGCRYGDLPNEAEHVDCQNHNAAAKDYVLDRAASIDAVLVVGTRTTEPATAGEVAPQEVVVDGLRAALAPWAKAGLPIVAIRDTPRQAFDVADCQATLTTSVQDCEGRLEDLVAPSNPALELSSGPDRIPGVRTMDLNDVVCPQGTCPPVIGNVNVWIDNSHLTAKFSSTTGAAFDRRMKTALGW